MDHIPLDQPKMALTAQSMETYNKIINTLTNAELITVTNHLIKWTRVAK